MNTFLYGPVPTLPNRATPQNTSEGEEAPHRFQTPGHAQLGTKQNDGPIYTPNGVHALLQRTNAKSTPTVTRVRKAPGTNLCFRACDAVPWKTSAQKAAEEAERVEAMRRRAAEEEEEKKKKAEEEEKEEEEVLCTQEEERKSLSSQLLPSFVAASRDAEKENAEGRVNVSDVKKRENDVKIASSAPLKTRVNDADADWKKQKAETADDDADFVRASLTPPKGGEKKARGENTSAGKRCVGSRDVSAALSARWKESAFGGLRNERGERRRRCGCSRRRRWGETKRDAETASKNTRFGEADDRAFVAFRRVRKVCRGDYYRAF